VTNFSVDAAGLGDKAAGMIGRGLVWPLYRSLAAFTGATIPRVAASWHSHEIFFDEG